MNCGATDIYPFTAIVGQEKMTRALVLSAVSPSLGGLLIKGEKGTGKSTAVRALAALLPRIDVVSGCPLNCDPHEYQRLCPECRAKADRGEPLPGRRRRVRVVDLPLNATEDMVAGSLDLESAIKEGKRRFAPGLLARAHRGILYVDEINLLDDHIVDLLLDAAAMGVNMVEREGVSCLHRAEFILIGTMNPEEGELRPHLLDRFGMCVEVTGIRDPDQRVRLIKLRERFDRNRSDLAEEHEPLRRALSRAIAGARQRLDDVRISGEMVRLCSELALEARVAGHRADILMGKAASAMASLEGRGYVTRKDVEEAADLVLFHRRRRSPGSSRRQIEENGKSRGNPPEDEKDRQKQEPDGHGPQLRETGEEDKGSGRDHQEAEGGMAARPVLETVLPVGDPFAVKRIHIRKDRKKRRGSGRRSRTRTSSRAGRYVRSTVERRNNDLALDATLRAAAPHQRGRTRGNVAIAIEQGDIREKVREKRIGNFIVFVVDASGSMGAEKRMTAVKGAVLSLLLDAYQKRDKVALVAFKGDCAETLLPPTSSIDLAHKLLEELPTGGRTPLCHGISLGYRIIQAGLRKDPDIYPLLILVSDGKANVSRYGGKPLEEAMEAAEEIGRDPRVRGMVVDVEKEGLISFGLARRLSFQMGARYFKIEDLRSDVLVGALRGSDMP